MNMMVPEALALCETARGVEGKPTLFWKLIPGNADHSPFTKNDVLRYSVGAAREGQSSEAIYLQCLARAVRSLARSRQ